MFKPAASASQRLHALVTRVSGLRDPRRLGTVGVLIVAAVAWRAYAATPAGKQEAPVPKAAQECAACHEDQVKSWAASVHRRSVGAPQLAADRQGCGGCHSGLAAHMKDASAHPPYLKQMRGDEVSGICLSCHKGGKQMMWHTTAHSKLQDGCLSCHDSHRGEGREMLVSPEPELCAKCHPQQVAETHLPSHHPIPEGKMSCTDCHNSHGDERGNLPAESNSEMCYRCHAEKAGPFLHEHPPVTEDCSICHKPHGAQNDRLLRMDQPMLCLQCHPGHHDSHRSPLVAVDATPAGAAQAVTGIKAFYDKCTSCHSLIHGTDLSSQTLGFFGGEGGSFMPGSPATPLGRTSAANPGYAWGVTGIAGLAMQGDGASWGFSGIELGSLDQSGNPTYVREYDGKNYEFPRTQLELDQYAAGSDFHLRVDGPAAGDPQVEAYFGNPTVSANIKYSELTHRQPRFNDPATDRIVPIAGNSVTATDLAGGKNDYQIGRQVTDINVAARHPGLRQVKWLARYWRESEKGDQQFLYMERCAGCHKFQTTQPIDRVTTELAGGAEAAFDKGALRYMHTEGRFENRAAETILAVYGTPPLARLDVPLFGVADNRTRADEVRMSAVPSAALALTGLWRSKERANLFNGSSLDVDTAGGGANWRIGPGLSLVTSFFSSDFDNGARALNSGSLSRSRKTTRAELRYTGLRGTTVSTGYKIEDVDRETEHALVPSNSKAKTWSANALTRLRNGLSLNVRYRKTATDVRLNFNPASPPEEIVDADGVVAAFPARWIAPPSDERSFSAVASYNLTSRLLGNLLYSRLDRDFDVGVNLRNPVTGLPVSIARRSSDDAKTFGGELYYGAGKRTRITAGAYKQEGNADSDVRYGAAGPDGIFTLPDTTLEFPPIESLATFGYDARIVRLDASHWLTPRLRLFGRYGRTATDGQIIANHLGDYLDQNPANVENVALTLNPFDITLQDRWIGVGYLVDPFTEVALSFQRRDWSNDSDSTQNGAFKLWRMGVRKKF